MNNGVRIPRDGDRIAAFGRPGSGKSTVITRALVRDIKVSGRTTLIYDPTGDVNKYLVSGSASRDVVDPRIVRVVASADEAIRAVHSRTLLGGMSRVFVLLARQGMKEKAEQFRKALNDDRTRGWILMADEAELVYGNQGIDTEDGLAGLKLVRNRQQRLYLVGQRPQWMSPLARNLCTHVCVFAADSRAFVEQGTREWGDPEDFETAYELEQFEYLYRGDYAKPPYPLRHALKDTIPWQ